MEVYTESTEVKKIIEHLHDIKVFPCKVRLINLLIVVAELYLSCLKKLILVPTSLLFKTKEIQFCSCVDFWSFSPYRQYFIHSKAANSEIGRYK